MERQPVRKEFKTLTYFAQPIYYDEENRLIAFLRDFCRITGMELKIKLHPRSPQPELEDIEIIDGKVSSQAAILETDLVVTRYSSVGLDCWYLNVPVLFFVGDILKADSIGYIPENYLGTIRGEMKPEDLVIKLEQIVSDFYNHHYHDNSAY